MSSQAGILRFDGRPILSEQQAVVLAALGERDRRVCLPVAGHCLLAVGQDTHSALRSGVAERGDLALSWEGSLHNQAELQQMLGKPQAAEAELLLSAYERWGAEAWNRVRGDWSAVLVNQRDRTVRLVSDSAGLRPLYFAEAAGAVVWSSYLGAVVGMAERGEELDRDWAAGFLSGVAPLMATAYKGVRCVPPGREVTVCRRGARERRFWQFAADEPTRFRTEQDYAVRLRELLQNALRVRAAGAEAVMAELSGGLDSSSVVAVAKAEAIPLTTLTYSDAGSPDLPYVSAMERHCGRTGLRLDLREFPFVAEQATGGAQPAWWQPLHRHVAAVMKERGASVLLNGQNGDLITGNVWDGVELEAAAVAEGRWGEAFGSCLAWSRAARQPLGSVLMRAVRAAMPSWLPVEWQAGAGGICGESLTTWTRRKAEELHWARDREGIWRSAPAGQRHRLRVQEQVLDSRVFAPGEELQRYACASPFLDRQVVEYLLTIPPREVCRAGEPRRLLRLAMRDLLPGMVLGRRSKAGYDSAFQHALRPLALSIAGKRELLVADWGLVEASEVRARLRRMALGLPAGEAQLRQILLLECWLSARRRLPDSREPETARFDDVSSVVSNA